jgi:hypothetical protein
VLFSSELYDGSTHQLTQGGGQDGAGSTGTVPEEPHWSHIPRGHITNLARNTSGPVWPLSQLASRLGPLAWKQLWDAIQVGAAMDAVRTPSHTETQGSCALYSFYPAGQEPSVCSAGLAMIEPLLSC